MVPFYPYPISTSDNPVENFKSKHTVVVDLPHQINLQFQHNTHRTIPVHIVTKNKYQLLAGPVIKTYCSLIFKSGTTFYIHCTRLQQGVVDKLGFN